MLINLRNALMAGKRLPYDAEVEYLESTGTQYIDTGVKPSNDLRTKFRAAYTHTPIENNSTIFGSRSTASSNDRYWLNYDSKFEVGYGSYYNTGVTVSPGEMFDVDFNYIENGDHKFKVNDSVFTYSGTPNTTIGIILFGRIVGAQVARCSSRFYSAQFFRNGVLVRNFIPVRKGAVGYLYDRVSGKLFGNAGSDDFVLGPDVVPVEYLRGDGSSAIETDIQWQLKAAYTEVDFRMPDARDSVSKRLLGTSAASFNYITARRATRADYFGFNAATDPLLELVSGTQYKGAAWYENDLYNFSLNDSVATYSATVHGAAGSFCVFDVMRSSYEGTCFKGDISAVRIYADKTKAQLLNNLQAVRVGNGSTWEGAMMDVLTRRIYRNAGTGAFAYGNDLKYPIPAE